MRPRRAALAAAAAAAVGWPFLAPETAHFYGVLSVVYALVALSVTVLAGWAGQISLGQAAFLGVGTYAGQHLLVTGVPLVLTLPLVALLGAAVSLALGVPSLRVRGIYLTIVTLAFAAACERFVFRLSWVRGPTARIVPRASFLGFSTETDRALYLVGLLVLVGALVLVANLRQSDPGRALFALRDAEEAAMALGVRVAPYKIGAFALASALATTAGVLYGMLFRATPGADQFGVLPSLFLLALPVIGGLRTLAGAVVGGVIFAVAQPVANLFEIRLFLASGAVLVLLTLARTDGLVGAAASFARSLSFTTAASTPGGGPGRERGRLHLRLGTPLPAGSRVYLRLRTGETR